MFRIQNWKQVLGLMALGSVFTIIGMLLSPVTAQRDKFGEIECTSLTVVDSEGNVRAVVKNVDDDFGGGIVELHNAEGTKTVELFAGRGIGGYVRVWSKDEGERGPGAIQLNADKNGGRLDIYGKGGAVLKRDESRYLTLSELGLETCVSVRVDSNGGGVVSVTEGETNGKRAHLMADRIGVWGKGGATAILQLDKIGIWRKSDGDKRGGSALLTVNSNGGRLDVYAPHNKNNAQKSNRAFVCVGSNGGGIVSVHNRNNGSASSVLRVNTNGGRLDVYGEGNQQPRATVQVNAHGNGTVSTWKKDGAKFHTLGKATRVPHSITAIADVIESKLDGDFEGWDGETVVKLMNGQIWQQTQYHYEYHYAFMPDVLIYKSGGRYKMLVDGTDEAVVVERLK